MNKIELMNAISRCNIDQRDVAAAWQTYADELGAKRDANPIRVLFYPGISGVAAWRTYPQACWLAADPRFDVRISTEICAADSDEADVVIFQRACISRSLTEVRRRADDGKASIVDLDDLIHDIPDYNPAKEAVRLERQAETYEAIARYATLLTYSTAPLERIYRSYLSEVYPKHEFRSAVLPLFIDPEAWMIVHPSPLYARHDAVVIGWEGSGTHAGDLAVVAPALKIIMEQNRHVWFALGQCTRPEFKGPLSALPRERCIEFLWDGFVHLGLRYTSMFDIGIAPLAENMFNRCKSDLKLLTYGLAGVPCVATDLDPYECCPNRVVRNDPNQWVRVLQRLIDDEVERKAQGEHTRRWVTSLRGPMARGPAWTEAILSCVERPTASPESCAAPERS